MIDARGLSCPEPVTMIKKAIATHEAQRSEERRVG